MRTKNEENEIVLKDSIKKIDFYFYIRYKHYKNTNKNIKVERIKILIKVLIIYVNNLC